MVQHWLFCRREQWQMISEPRSDVDSMSMSTVFSGSVLCIRREGSEFATWRLERDTLSRTKGALGDDLLEL